ALLAFIKDKLANQVVTPEEVDAVLPTALRPLFYPELSRLFEQPLEHYRSQAPEDLARRIAETVRASNVSHPQKTLESLIEDLQRKASASPKPTLESVAQQLE